MFTDISRQLRRHKQRSGSGGSVTSVADSVGSLGGSTSVPSLAGGMRKGVAESSPLRRVEGSADHQGSRTRSPAGDWCGVDVRTSGHPDPDVQSDESGKGEGLLGSDRHRVERSRSRGSREDFSGPPLVALVASRSTGDRAMVRSSGPMDRSGRRFRSTCLPALSAGRSSGPPVRSTSSLILRSEFPDMDDMMKNTGINVVTVAVEAVHVCEGQARHHHYLRMTMVTGATTDVVVTEGEVGDTAMLLRRSLFRPCVKSC